LRTSVVLLAFFILPFFSSLTIAETNSPFGSSNSSFSGTSSSDEDFLPAEEAFKLEAFLNKGSLRFQWVIADDYYLYKHRFKFDVLTPANLTLEEPLFSRQGKSKEDPLFGTVEAYYHSIDIDIPIPPSAQGVLEIKVGYQGCADKGLCYIPQDRVFTFNLSSASPASTVATAKNITPTQNNGATPADTDSAQGIASLLSNRSLFALIGIFFVLGLGLTFTPCVLPMIPILSSIVVGQNTEKHSGKAFMLSLMYVLGMASTYAAAGVIAGLSGSKLLLYMQNPTVLFSFSGIFVLLSLSLFGFYELQLPSKLQDRLNNMSQHQKGGTFLGVFIMGSLSALVVSPCVSAPLAGALLYISNTGDGVLGGVSLLALGLGMGAPLLVIGTTGGSILPKAGEWMNAIKGLFGVALLAVAVWLIKHLLPETVTLSLWAALLILAAVYFGAFQPTNNTKAQLFKGLGLALALLGASLMFKAINSNGTQSTSSAPNLLDTTTNTTPFKRIYTQAQLTDALTTAQHQNKPVILDYYADWCISCIEMEHEAFNNTEVKQLLKQHQWLQIDLTDNPEAEALLDQFDLLGPPSILFFNRKGKEITNARVYAYQDEVRFISHLKSHQLNTQ